VNLGGLDAQVSAWKGLLCWRPAEVPLNLRWLAVENLGTIFNYRPDLLGPEGWTRTPAGHSWLAGGALVLMVTIATVETIRGRRNIAGGNWSFGVYLMAVAAQSALAYAVLGCSVQDRSLLRYTLLTLYFPVGLLVLFLTARPRAWSRRLVTAALVVWGACSLVDSSRFLAAYVHSPPPSPSRELVNFLESQGVRYGRAPYWVAYQLDFLSQERLTIASLEKVRVAEYQKIVDQHRGQAIEITHNVAWHDHGCEHGVALRFWCLENLDRARHVTQSRSGRG
jgi:hypothetical protein